MIVCLLLAGGTGTRTGLDMPKQYVLVAGKPVFSYAAETLSQCPEIDEVVLVGDPQWFSFVMEWAQRLGLEKIRQVVEGGRTRQHSIYNGLNAIRPFMRDADLVLVHDAARPILKAHVLQRLLAVAREKGSALPVVKVHDALYVSEDGSSVNRILPVKGACMGQTPVCFSFGPYYGMHAATSEEELEKATGSCSLPFLHHQSVPMVDGDPEAFKITTHEDLRRFEAFIAAANSA